MYIVNPGSSKHRGIDQEPGKPVAMGEQAALRHSVEIYSFKTPLCALHKGRSKNINPTTFQLAQPSAGATGNCLEKSKSGNILMLILPPSSDNLQPRNFLSCF